MGQVPALNHLLELLLNERALDGIEIKDLVRLGPIVQIVNLVLARQSAFDRSRKVPIAEVRGKDLSIAVGAFGAQKRIPLSNVSVIPIRHSRNVRLPRRLNLYPIHFIRVAIQTRKGPLIRESVVGSAGDPRGIILRREIRGIASGHVRKGHLLTGFEINFHDSLKSREALMNRVEPAPTQCGTAVQQAQPQFRTLK